MDREAWWAFIHRVAKSQTGLKLPSTKAILGNNELEYLHHIILGKTKFRG